MYKKTNEFFEMQKDKCILQCLDYDIERLTHNSMKFTQYGANKSSIDLIIVQYVDTEVIKIDIVNKTIQLKNDNWFSMTTKKIINTYLFRYGYHIRQYKSNWYILKGLTTIKGEKTLKEGLLNENIIEFENNMILTFNK